jgi:hypothetical protein
VAVTVASTLEVLELTGHDDRWAFFQALLPVADRVRLHGLAFRFFQRPSCPLLCECLPRLVHVRTLKLCEFIRYRGEAIDFVRAMKTNGSLHGVAINFGTVEECPLTHRYQRLVQAYCQRNKALHNNFLASVQVRERPSGSVDSDELGDPLDCPPSLSVPSTAPTALDSAMQAPRLAPNNVFKALVRLGERLSEDDGGRKRKRLAGVTGASSDSSTVETETTPNATQTATL